MQQPGPRTRLAHLPLVRFTGCREHLSRAALEFSIGDFADLSPSVARQIVDQLVAGKNPDVAVPDISAAHWLRAYAVAVGAQAEVIT